MNVIIPKLSYCAPGETVTDSEMYIPLTEYNALQAQLSAARDMLRELHAGLQQTRLLMPTQAQVEARQVVRKLEEIARVLGEEFPSLDGKKAVKEW